MNFQTLFFSCFSAILIFAALRVITVRNPVHSALYLVLSFFSAAAIWILLKAEFLALILMLVYVGAVMVLFLFVVMMLDIKLAVIRENFRRNMVVAIPVGILIVFEMVVVLMKGFWVEEPYTPEISNTVGLTYDIGIVLYTKYLYAFEIAAAILLVAMVAAVALTLRRRKDVKYTSSSKAIHARKDDNLRLIEIKADTAYAKQEERKTNDTGEKK